MSSNLYELFTNSDRKTIENFLNTLQPGSRKQQIAQYVANHVYFHRAYSHRTGVEAIYGIAPTDPSFRKYYQSYYHLYKELSRNYQDFLSQTNNRSADDYSLSTLLSNPELLFYRARNLYRNNQNDEALKLLRQFLQMTYSRAQHPTSELLAHEAFTLYLKIFLGKAQGGALRTPPRFWDQHEAILAQSLLHWLWGWFWHCVAQLRLHPSKSTLDTCLQQLALFQHLSFLAPYQQVLTFFQAQLQSVFALLIGDQDQAQAAQETLQQLTYADPQFDLSFLQFLRLNTDLDSQLQHAMNAVLMDRLEEAAQILEQARSQTDFHAPEYPYFLAHLLRIYFALDNRTAIDTLLPQLRAWAQRFDHSFYYSLAQVFEVQLAISQPSITLPYKEMLQRLATIENQTGDILTSLSVYRTQAQIYYRFEQLDKLSYLVERLRQRRFKQLHPRIIRSFIRLLYYALHRRLFTLPIYEHRFRTAWASFRRIRQGERIFKAPLIRWIETFVIAQQ